MKQLSSSSSSSKIREQQLDKTALIPWYVKAKFLSGKGKGPDHTQSECSCYSFVCVCLAASIMSYSAISWTVARQAPLSMGFSRQEFWSGVPLSSKSNSIT